MNALNTEITEENGVTVAAISGPVDSATCQDFKASLALLTKMQVPRVVLDFKDLTYMNSSAFGVLVKFYRSTNVKMRKIVICNQSPRIEKGMALLGLQHHIHVYPSREDAIEALLTEP